MLQRALKSTESIVSRNQVFIRLWIFETLESWRSKKTAVGQTADRLNKWQKKKWVFSKIQNHRSLVTLIGVHIWKLNFGLDVDPSSSSRRYWLVLQSVWIPVLLILRFQVEENWLLCPVAVWTQQDSTPTEPRSVLHSWCFLLPSVMVTTTTG